MFDEYICKTTGLPCCGCSFYCEHREKTQQSEKITKRFMKRLPCVYGAFNT